VPNNLPMCTLRYCYCCCGESDGKKWGRDGTGDGRETGEGHPALSECSCSDY